MKLFDRREKPVVTGAIVGRGGEATVYRVANQPGWLAKIYEPAPRSDYPDKLAWMVEHPPANPTRGLGHPSLAWPSALLYEQGKRLAGYMMPHIQKAVPVLVVFNPRRRRETLPQFDRRYLHRAARNLAAAVGALHSGGYVVGDLNESNILVTASALVTLIDTDSFQVQEQRGGGFVTHYCPVAKIEYTPPELQGRPLDGVVRSPEQDAFSLGVLIFQLLMEGNHPFRAQWLGGGDPPPIEIRIAQGGFPYTASPPCPVCPPKSAPDLNLLHPEISELLRRCFVDGHLDPSLRPSPMAWERGIAEAEKTLVQCPNRHIYSGHLCACPVCHAPQPGASGASRPVGRESPPNQAQERRPYSGSPNASQAPPASSTAARPQPSTSSANTGPGSPVSGAPVGGTSSAGSPPGPRTRPNGPAAAGRQASSSAGAGPAPGPSQQSRPSQSAASGKSPGSAWDLQQARRAWNTWKYWQAQQAQPPLSGPIFRSSQAQQALRAYQTWKYWQDQNRTPQKGSHQKGATQNGAPQSSGAAPPPGQSRPAGSPGQTQPRHSQPVNPQPGQPQPGSPQPGPAQAQPGQAPVQNRSTQTGNAQSWTASHSRSRPSQPWGPPRQSPPAYATAAATPANPQSTWRPAQAAYASPRPAPAPVWHAPRFIQPSGGVWSWMQPRILKSLAIGGGLGALVGSLLGALAAVASWSSGNTAAWAVLWALGGAAGGMLRGWQPGYRMSLQVNRAFGWDRVWPIFGLVAGAAIGGSIGLLLGWWAILPVFLGLGLGGWLGSKAGRKIWQAGNRVGWERIWAGVGAGSAALVGCLLARWAGASGLGSLTDHLASSLAFWIMDRSASWALVWLAIGALGGALGGALAGASADLFARFFGLVD